MACELTQGNTPPFKKRSSFVAMRSTRIVYTRRKRKLTQLYKHPAHKMLHKVRSFLGLVNFYNHFLPNFSMVVQPLNNLLERDHKWEWTTACEEAFGRAKELVASDQVLTHYDPDLPIRIASDAFPYGTGTVLSCM